MRVPASGSATGVMMGVFCASVILLVWHCLHAVQGRRAVQGLRAVQGVCGLLIPSAEAHSYRGMSCGVVERPVGRIFSGYSHIFQPPDGGVSRQEAEMIEVYFR